MIQEDEEPEQHRKERHHPIQQPLFSKIRSLNHLALTSFGSLFSGTSASKNVSDREDVDGEINLLVDSITGLELEPENNANMVEEPSVISGPTDQLVEDYWEHQRINSRPDRETSGESPDVHSDAPKLPGKAHISTLSSESRRFFGGLSRSRRFFHQNRYSNTDFMPNASPEAATGSAPLSSTATFPSASSLDESIFSLPSETQFVFHADGNSGELDTPPLTPDSFNNRGLLSSTTLPLSSLLEPSLAPSRFSSQSMLSRTSEEAPDDAEGGDVYTSPYLREIKEGKRPERVIDLDQDNTGNELDANILERQEDLEEWYGLEYTLEISSRERQPLESQSFSAGEHSKSRESWAAIHQGTIHPFFEDEDYRQWKNWHRFLDRQAERKRHKKGYEFKSRSKDLAWFYVDEIRTRDVLYWQKEVFGVVARDVKERLQYIVEHRPDPFFPPQKHNWSWYLKRSRSAACLRELKMRPLA